MSPKLYPLNHDLKKTWFIKYNDANGKPRKVYGQLNNLPTVKKRLHEADKLIGEILLPGSQQEQRKNDLIGNLCELLEYKRPMIEKKSYQSFFSIIKGFAEWYRKSRQENKNIDPADYVRFMFDNNLHRNTIRNRTIVLRGFINELIRQKKQVSNPFEGIKIKRIKSQSKLPFSKDQIKKLLPVVAECDPQLRDVIDFLFYLFFRPAEIRLLKVEHILFESMQVIASDDFLKDDDNYLKAIPLPMQQKILKYMDYPPHFYIFSANGLPGEKPLSRENLSKRMTAILRRLYFYKRYTMYSWVHTGIKEAAMSGIPLKQLQLQKGHSDLKMFDEYLKNIGVNDCSALVANFPEL